MAKAGAEDTSSQGFSNHCCQDSLQSSDDFGCRDFSLSDNDITITKNSTLAQLIHKERIISFETSLPTTSTICDQDEEPFSFTFMRSMPNVSDSETTVLSKAQFMARHTKSYNSFASNNPTPQNSVKSRNVLSSISRSVTMSVEIDYQPGKKCTNLQTLMNAYKGNAGPGILSLPYAFKNGGLWVGMASFFLVAAVAVHTMHILSRCTDYIENRLDTKVNDYPEVVEVIFEECSPPRLKKYSVYMRHVVSTLIVVMQCGFCCVYVVFVATNIKEVVDPFWAGSPSIVVYELLVFLCLVPYLMIRCLKTLAFFSLIANFVSFAGLIIIFQYLWRDLPPASRLPAFSSYSTFPLLLGNVIFSFEGISLVVPLRNKMKDTEAFGGSFGVLSLAMTLHVALCAAMGFYGYLRFGEDTAAIITLNLPQDNTLHRSVGVMYALVVFLSTAVQFYVPINSVWPQVEKRLTYRFFFHSSDWRLVLAETITRFALMTLILLVAIVVPHVDMLIALVGAFMGSLLTIILPGILDMILLKFRGKLNAAVVVKDVAIIILGVVVLITGTYISLQEIVLTYKSVDP